MHLAQIPGLDEGRFHRFLAPVLSRQDPRQDGWEMEVAAEVIADQLKSLGELIAGPAQIDPQKLEPLATVDFSASPLRPHILENVLVNDRSLAVFRAPSAAAAG